VSPRIPLPEPTSKYPALLLVPISSPDRLRSCAGRALLAASLTLWPTIPSQQAADRCYRAAFASSSTGFDTAFARPLIRLTSTPTPVTTWPHVKRGRAASLTELDLPTATAVWTRHGDTLVIGDSNDTGPRWLRLVGQDTAWSGIGSQAFWYMDGVQVWHIQAVQRPCLS